MLSVYKLDESEYARCKSCGVEHENSVFYRIKVGESILLELCYDCMCNLIGQAILGKKSEDAQ